MTRYEAINEELKRLHELYNSMPASDDLLEIDNRIIMLEQALCRPDSDAVEVAVAAEREACAVLVEPRPPLRPSDHEWLALEQAAEAIRARGTP